MTRNVLSITIIAIFIGVSVKLLLTLDAVSAHVGDEAETVVHMADDGFSPKEVTIKQGETVIFENTAKNPHWPASNIHPTHRIYPDSGIDKCAKEEEKKIFDACNGIPTGESYSFKFEYPGIWRYHDHLNPSFKGSVTVVGEGDNSQEDSQERVEQQEGLVKRVVNFLKEMINRISIKLLNKSLFSLEEGDGDYVFDEGIKKDSSDIFTNDDALYSFVKKYGPSATTQHLASLGLSFGDCHNRAHETGRLAYQIYDAEAFQTCSSECHSGCYHGATEAFFRDHGTQELSDNLKIICSSFLNPFFSHQCVHGIGHGLMAFSDYEIDEALASCDLLDESLESCYTGVFMENIVGGLAEEHYTKYLNEDPLYPCTVVEPKYKSACYFNQTSRMVQLFAGDFAKVAAVCYGIDETYHRSCFESMGRDVGGVYRGNPQGAIAACKQAPEEHLRIWCLIGAVQDSFWDPSGQDDAIEFCRLLSVPEEKSYCYATIFIRAPQVLGTKDELLSFCEKAEEDYLQECLDYIQ